MDKTKLTGHGFNIMHLKERSQERQMRMCTLTLAFAGQRRGADHTHTRCPSSAIRVVSATQVRAYSPAFGYGTKSSCAMFVASVSAIGPASVLFPPVHTAPVAWPLGLCTVLFQNCANVRINVAPVVVMDVEEGRVIEERAET